MPWPSLFPLPSSSADVLNVSGHRLGSAEIESALVANHKVSEAAVIGFPHETKGGLLWRHCDGHGSAMPASAVGPPFRSATFLSSVVIRCLLPSCKRPPQAIPPIIIATQR